MLKEKPAQGGSNDGAPSKI